ncbi:MAG TPA: bacteriohopanetetrol glucosamine biosynthesis glycosyltransferase HpnI [Blastocatellia bacterium]|nr:bacteriohopanetetrol glucosamine biosynthesis glycosyltransferase HpnI [Blastocatellia bacterium]
MTNVQGLMLAPREQKAYSSENCFMVTWFYIAGLILLGVLTLGGWAYYLLAIDSVRKLRRRKPAQAAPSFPLITLIKPLCGADPELESHLASFFRQNYPAFEILFAVRHNSDPAVQVVHSLTAKYPHIATQMILTGEPPYANAKVFSMEKMAAAAKGELLVITDSDASVAPDYLQDMARCFADPTVGAVTNLYRGIPGADLWSTLEALGMSTEFMAGVVVAERLEGMHFTLGPSMAIRATTLNEIGGFARMADYLADDFVLGQWTAEAGQKVVLSTHVINHHATAMGFRKSFKHRVRWNRSSRFSRPSGYVGQGFTYGLAWALLLFAVTWSWWSGLLLMLVAAARWWLAYELGFRLMGDAKAMQNAYLIPLQDLLSMASWIGGFVGREVIWRNERYRLLHGGRFEPVVPRPMTQ